MRKFPYGKSRVISSASTEKLGGFKKQLVFAWKGLERRGLPACGITKVYSERVLIKWCLKAT